MTKQKATRKEIRNAYHTIYNVGYCGLSYLLRAYEASYYNAGTFGWNWDCYIVAGGTAIITGYRNAIGQTIDYETTQKYNKLAEAICKNGKFNWDETKAQLETLMAQMLEKLKEG